MSRQRVNTITVMVDCIFGVIGFKRGDYENYEKYNTFLKVIRMGKISSAFRRQVVVDLFRRQNTFGKWLQFS